MLVKVGALSALVLMGGCAQWGTGVVPPSRANGDANAGPLRNRTLTLR